MEKQRLDKFISNQLLLSRSVVKAAIRKGGARVNGDTIRNPALIFDVQAVEIEYFGKKVDYKKNIYILMNKPMGVLSASSDSSRKTVVDLVPDQLRRNSIFPVGRLDKDTTGLLLITDDGVFAHNCIAPKKMISKAYIADLDGEITDEMVINFRKGVVLADGTVCAPALLHQISSHTARVVIREGKYHQIKRMFGTVGLGVNKLHRESIGGLYLPNSLCEGDCIEMNKDELECKINRDSYVF